MENNFSIFSDVSDFPEMDNVVNIWSFYEYISYNTHPTLVPDMGDDNISSSGDFKSAYPSINGSAGIGDPINITNELPLSNLSQHLINSFIVLTCLLGLVGNGFLIWLLGFLMKRNPFTTYILNLSIADFGVLISLLATSTFRIVADLYNRNYVLSVFFLLFLELFFFMYSTGQFLLAAISIDRCVAVLFPLWHRCHRPPRLSTIVCSLIWILSFLLSGIHFTLQMTGSFGNAPLWFQLIVNALLCMPLMLISTLTLFIHVCCKSKQRQQGMLVMAILLAVLFFLLFAFPMNALYVIHSFYAPHHSLMVTGFVCASLNSSINPLIYFFIGRRQKKGQPRVSMKAAFQRVFRDEQDSVEDQYTTSTTKA